MERTIRQQVRGFVTHDGAGVRLVRVLGSETVRDYDPILMLDSFDSTNPDDYTPDFPLHPHRGIETISYVYSGAMTHKDSLGNEDTIGSGEVQWMTPFRHLARRKTAGYRAIARRATVAESAREGQNGASDVPQY
jgi:redox-sensitive bicupin YhaK (pirin superfamily)